MEKGILSLSHSFNLELSLKIFLTASYAQLKASGKDENIIQRPLCFQTCFFFLACFVDAK
jgi:hypothetical protein